MPETSPVPYTVVGGSRGPAEPSGLPASVLLLGRGRRLYRAESLAELERLGFGTVVSVEPPGEARDLEGLSQRFPRVRFLMLGAEASPGTMINLGMRESAARHVLVLWGDMKVVAPGLSGRFFEKLAEQDHLCLAPWLLEKKGEQVPCAIAPAMEGKRLRLLPLPPGKDGARSLYPFDYAGIYSRDKFLLTGGYDETMGNPHWQKLDFGFRSWLWGEEIRISSSLKVAYEASPPPDDLTAGPDYERFWLRNLAPTFRADHALIPPGRFFAYLAARRREPLQAWREFREAAAWVGLHRYRYRLEASSVVDLWEDSSS